MRSYTILSDIYQIAIKLWQVVVCIFRKASNYAWTMCGPRAYYARTKSQADELVTYLNMYRARFKHKTKCKKFNVPKEWSNVMEPLP